MNGTHPPRAVCLTALIALMLCLAAPASAVVIHPGESAPSHTPDAALTAQWGSNASAVVVGTSQVLTTRHQGGGVGTTVTVDGVDYVVAEITNIGSADLRLATLTTPTGADAQFSQWASLYSGNSVIGQTIVMAGYGKGAEQTNTNGIIWADEPNDTLRFGTNIIDTFDTTEAGPYESDTLRIDFDNATRIPGEAAMTEFDSGSGWFIETTDGWELVGIGAYVQQFDQSNYGDNNWAIDLTSYRDDINNATIPEPASLVLLAFGAAALGRRRRV